MEIAFFTFHFPVLSETFIMNQVTGLIDQGHDVRIFCETSYSDDIRHSDVEKYHLIDRTVYYEIENERLPENKLLRAGKAIWLLFSHRKNNFIPLLKSLNLFKYGKKSLNLRMFYLMVHFIENNIHHYDLILCHFGPNGDLASTLKDMGLFQGKVVTIFHGEAGYENEKKYLSEKAYQNKGYKTLFKQCDLFLPMTEKEKQNLITLGCNPEKIEVHRMGVDLNKFDLSQLKPKSSSNVKVITVGRLVEKKGIEYGIQAVAKVLKSYPNIKYKIAGDGYLRDDLQNLIDRLDSNNQVEIIGAKTQEEVIELISESDLFLAPSVNSRDGDREGLPVVLMEAMAYGLPVLSTFHSGIPELVEDGVSGFLVPERDVDGLASKLLYLLENRSKWDEMGKEGRRRVEHQHDIQKLNNRLLSIFENLLNQHTNN